jgi:hypothetical protein
LRLRRSFNKRKSLDLTNKYLHKLLKDTKTWQVVLFGLCIKGLVLVDECDLWILSSGILL